MGIFKKKVKVPTLLKEDIPKEEKVIEFVSWFMMNDPNVRVISSPSSNIIFKEGVKPKCEENNNPYSFQSDIGTLQEWFGIKVYMDLNNLKDSSKEEFRNFIDKLDEISTKTLMIAGELGQKYNLNLGDSSYEEEIKKISDEKDLESFKQNYFSDNILGAELRILAWLYHEYFGEWYQLKESR